MRSQNWAAFWDVRDAVVDAVDGAVYWAVYWAVDRAVEVAVCDPVWEAVNGAVDSVKGAMFEDPAHPAFEDFLRSAGRDA